MARISLDPPRSLTSRLTGWYSRRRFGENLEPALAMAHHPKLLRWNARAELGAERWRATPPAVKHLAVMAAAATVGCEWCMDFGYWLGMAEAGIDPVKIHDVPRWRNSIAYTDVERAALEYGEAMSTTPTAVTDELVERLRSVLGDAALVELTMMIAVENQRARFNSALGLHSQAFSDRCELRPISAA